MIDYSLNKERYEYNIARFNSALSKKQIARNSDDSDTDNTSNNSSKITDNWNNTNEVIENQKLNIINNKEKFNKWNNTNKIVHNDNGFSIIQHKKWNETNRITSNRNLMVIDKIKPHNYIIDNFYNNN